MNKLFQLHNTDLITQLYSICFAILDGGEPDEDDPEEAPVRLRRKRFVPRRDRAVNSLATSLDSNNYNLISAPLRRDEVR
jgi:hypothetical protein